MSKKSKARQKSREGYWRPGMRMMPMTRNVLGSALHTVWSTLNEYGDEFRRFLEERGITLEPNAFGADLPGPWIPLPPQVEHTRAILSLLAVLPVLAEEYGETDLQAKPSPVQFERTRGGRIIFSPRFIVDRFEDLASFPKLQPMAKFARQWNSRKNITLPRDTQTFAVEVEDSKGTVKVFEALAPGTTFTWTMEMQRDESITLWCFVQTNSLWIEKDGENLDDPLVRLRRGLVVDL